MQHNQQRELCFSPFILWRVLPSSSSCLGGAAFLSLYLRAACPPFLFGGAAVPPFLEGGAGEERGWRREGRRGEVVVKATLFSTKNKGFCNNFQNRVCDRNSFKTCRRFFFFVLLLSLTEVVFLSRFPFYLIVILFPASAVVLTRGAARPSTAAHRRTGAGPVTQKTFDHEAVSVHTGVQCVCFLNASMCGHDAILPACLFCIVHVTPSDWPSWLRE